MCLLTITYEFPNGSESGMVWLTSVRLERLDGEKLVVCVEIIGLVHSPYSYYEMLRRVPENG